VFIPLGRNADDITDYFRIPTNHVVETGTHALDGAPAALDCRPA
jgi:hypothetical protein